ncbi:MAG TPA: DUF4388 domain-containing protein [Coleofasciculaceae cyanobacterium]
MSTKASLKDVSLPEIFQLIEKGHKTGLLRLCALSEFRAKPALVYYIWVYKGRIVAAANQLNQQGLVSLIAKHHGVRDRIVANLAQSCPLDQPLGLCLKNRFVLETQQLEHLFQIQVLQQMCALFDIENGQFEFHQNVPIPTREMTGFSVPPAVLNQYCSIKVLSEDLTIIPRT